MGIKITNSAVPEEHEVLRHPDDVKPSHVGKLFIDSDDDAFLCVSCDAGYPSLVWLGRYPNRDGAEYVTWPLHLAPPNITVTIKNTAGE